jgi:chromosome partitioning protein
MLDRQPLQIHLSNVPNLDIVPAHILLSNVDIELTSAMDHREARLKQQLDQIAHEYDHVIVDCPPALSWLTLNAFTAADAVLVVVAPGYFELDSTVQIGRTISEVRKLFNPALSLAGFVFVLAEPTKNSNNSLQVLRQTYADDVLRTVIPKNVDIKDAHFAQKDIFAYNPKASSALAYQKLIMEIFNV